MVDGEDPPRERGALACHPLPCWGRLELASKCGERVTWWSFPAITLIVLATLVIRNPRLQASVYSLPLPISIAILGSPHHQSPLTILGVTLLVVFFFCVAALRNLPRILAVSIATVLLLLVQYFLLQTFSLTLAQAVGFHFGAWGVWFILHRLWVRRAHRAEPRPSNWQVSPRSLASIPIATGASMLGARFIGPFVITFPYSGIPVSLLLEKEQISPFARTFADRSVLIGVFIATYSLAITYLPSFRALGLAWLAYLILSGFVLALEEIRKRRTRSQPPPGLGRNQG